MQVRLFDLAPRFANFGSERLVRRRVCGACGATVAMAERGPAGALQEIEIWQRKKGAGQEGTTREVARDERERARARANEGGRGGKRIEVRGGEERGRGGGGGGRHRKEVLAHSRRRGGRSWVGDMGGGRLGMMDGECEQGRARAPPGGGGWGGLVCGVRVCASLGAYFLSAAIFAL